MSKRAYLTTILPMAILFCSITTGASADHRQYPQEQSKTIHVGWKGTGFFGIGNCLHAELGADYEARNRCYWDGFNHTVKLDVRYGNKQIMRGIEWCSAWVTYECHM